MSVTPGAPSPQVLEDEDLVVRGVEVQPGDEASVRAFTVVWQGEQVGRVELLLGDTGDAEVIWLFVAE